MKNHREAQVKEDAAPGRTFAMNKTGVGGPKPQKTGKKNPTLRFDTLARQLPV